MGLLVWHIKKGMNIIIISYVLVDSSNYNNVQVPYGMIYWLTSVYLLLCGLNKMCIL